MDKRKPVYTENAECRDCYKCVRSCAVKAIGMQNDHATVLPERCIGCGRCVEVCPAGAKRVRDDLPRVKHRLAQGGRVFLSLAPSYASEFRGVDRRQLIHAIRQLGFAGVSETALGAEQVSAEIAARLERDAPGIVISSACPAVVELLTKYIPGMGPKVTGLTSPLLAHCRLLKSTYGDEVAIVFAGPCVAKKIEADRHPDLLAAAITFEDLRSWLEAERLPLFGRQIDADDRFLPQAASDGAMYPVDGGMIASIKACGRNLDATFAAFSGMETIRRALEGIDDKPLGTSLFLELLACEGGCVNGPKSAQVGGTIRKRQAILDHLAMPENRPLRTPSVDTSMPLRVELIGENEYSESQLREGLREVGKYSSLDELNCGGCGYENCRAFARALLDGVAERSMCVSHMRKLAQTKANILMKTMPSGVVVVDQDMKIVECNANFAKLLGQEVFSIYEVKPGLQGASLKRLVPFHAAFDRVLRQGDRLVEKDLRSERGVYQVSIFTIEPHRLVGAILRDVTEPVVQKERIVAKARQVMVRNLNTVQEIARLLGENAAESETMLSSIVDSFDNPHRRPETNDE